MLTIDPFVAGEKYDPSTMIYLRNPKQSFVFAKYIKLYDVILSNDGFAYVFSKHDSKILLEKWRNYELV